MRSADAAVSPDNRRVARHAAVAFGGRCRVVEYACESEELMVGVLRCPDRPSRGLTSYSTVKLSDHPMMAGAREFPTRLELAGVCVSSAAWFPNVLASAAFTIMRSDAVYRPGTLMADQVRRYHPSGDMPHLYLTAPFVWERELTSLHCGAKRVSWLLAVPISQVEREHLGAHGDAALERLLEEWHADFADPDRDSVL